MQTSIKLKQIEERLELEGMVIPKELLKLTDEEKVKRLTELLEEFDSGD